MADNKYEQKHEELEKKGFTFTVLATVAILIGSIIEVVPPFFLAKTVTKIDAVTVYEPLELAGRRVYMSEGCNNCHSQMIRPFKWETDRFDPRGNYGAEPYSKAGEYVFDHPFLWGSKRTGPDLAHESMVQPSAAWQKSHLINPRSTDDKSIMPAYPWLFEADNLVDADAVKADMWALNVASPYDPYQDADFNKVEAQVKGKTKGDALVAYLLKLGRDTAQQ